VSTNNLQELHDSGHTISLHSDTHPTQKNNLSYERQLEEYIKNYDFINSIINAEIYSMSHPCGCYNDDTFKVMKKLGIKCGFRSSLTPAYIKSALEIPREGHTNILNNIKVK